jgi:hypothetical protein
VAAVAVVAPDADVGVALGTLEPIGILLPLVGAVVMMILALRMLAGRRTPPILAGTWGCGYPEPTATMQYTSTSFGEPLTRVAQPLLRTDTHVEVLAGAVSGVAWPRDMRWASRTSDPVLARVYRPLFAAVARAGAALRARHKPRVTTALLYIVLTVVVLLALLLLPGARG